MSLSPADIRRQFPLLGRTIGTEPLMYLDSAATAQKPDVVFDAVREFETTINSNPHRGMHVLAEEATIAFEDARKTIQQFIGAASADEVIFTKNATEGINLVARSLGSTWNAGDAVVLSPLEHHSNIVPWLQLKAERGIDVRWMTMHTDGSLDMDSLDAHLQDGKVKLVGITAQSNVLGVRPQVKEMLEKAHAHNALVLVDAAQSIAHQKTDVAELDTDFLVFSGHKLYGPTGIGVLYGKRTHLKHMPPFLGGGMMIKDVHEDSFTAADAPQKFEAGTQPVAQAVGLAAAINWLQQFSWSNIEEHEQSVLIDAHTQLSEIQGLHILGPTDPRAFHGCISFVVDGVHPHDLTDVLGKKGVCLRAGHHCAQILHQKLGVTATTRLSVGIYNTTGEIDLLVPILKDSLRFLQR